MFCGLNKLDTDAYFGVHGQYYARNGLMITGQIILGVSPRFAEIILFSHHMITWILIQISPATHPSSRLRIFYNTLKTPGSGYVHVKIFHNKK